MTALAYTQHQRGNAVPMTKEEFAARLRELREEKGWTQAELAERAGVSAQAVAQWERALREPTWNGIIALADAFEISTEAFRQLPREIPQKRKAGRPPKAKPADQPPQPPTPPAAEPETPAETKRRKGK